MTEIIKKCKFHGSLTLADCNVKTIKYSVSGQYDTARKIHQCKKCKQESLKAGNRRQNIVKGCGIKQMIKEESNLFSLFMSVSNNLIGKGAAS